MADGLHRILRNQLLQHFGSSAIPRTLEPFIRSVNRAYHELDCGYDRDTVTTDRAEIVRRCQAAMLELAPLDTMDIESALRKLTRVAAEMFGVERVGIWMYDSHNTALVCRTLYLRSTGTCDSGLCVLARDYPGYFKALSDHLVIAAHDAHVDPRTREFADVYLKPQGIGAMMDVPFRHRGRVVGVLCHAHAGVAREWTYDEQEFAGALAKLISLALESEDRRKAEAEMARLLSLQMATLEATEDGILVVDTQGRIVSYNTRFVEMWKIPADVLASNRADVAIAYVLDQLAAPQEFMAKVKEVNAQDHAESFDLLEFRDGRAFERYSGPQKLDGLTVGRVWSFHDITDRRVAERREQELRDKLARAARMESLGLLAGGVAHDLNNILGPLVGYPDLVLDRLPPESPLVADIKEMKESALRAAAIIQDLLAMARRGSYKLESMNLNSVVETYIGSASFVQQKSRNPQVAVNVHLDPDMMPMQGSAPHLGQVVMNLVTNAFEAITGPGTLTISTACEYIDLPKRGFDMITEGEYAVVRVLDSGVGIAPADLERIFEPFYTRKQMGRSGTGLGLAVVYGVVKDLKGYIDVQSTPGSGSVFSVYFPICRATVKPAESEIMRYRDDKVILVVDDIKEQRELTEKILSHLGYCVITVPDGCAAVEFLAKSKADLVILDMILGDGVDGLDVYRNMLEVRSRQPCIIVSGYAETDRVRHAQSLGAGEYIRKPFSPERLARSVWDAMHLAKGGVPSSSNRHLPK
ncbi:MAG: ATP-binding protein [bacterium]